MWAACALILAACSGEIGDADPRPGSDGETLPFEPFEAAMQRLTIAQYQNSVNDILGPGLDVPSDLEPDTTISGFVSIGASRTTISPTGVEKYEDAAFIVARQALAPDRRDSIVPCTPAATVDATCTEEFVRAMGLRFFRRPLSDAETTRYVGLAGEAAGTLDDFYAGLEFALAGFLQSPRFLFRIEVGSPSDSDPDVRQYSDWEMASRLSYVLWNSTPDLELLDAASRGELTTDDGLRVQVERMLASDRAREAVRNFFRELLVLDEVLEVEKNAAVFPDFDEEFRRSAQAETLALIEEHVFDADGDYRELFTTRDTFLNADLAAHYGLEGEFGTELEPVTLPEEIGRRGLLGHASLLSIYSHDEKTSAALRGRFVRQVLLCGNIPNPPDDVSTVFPPSDAPTLRERVEQHLMNDGCAGCHSLMDPIGLGLENFDAVGAWRPTENGATIDPSGVVDGVDFADAADLGRVVAEHPNVGACITRSLYRYASGHTESAVQEEEIQELVELFASDGYRVRGLLGELVMSPGFRQASAKTEEGE